MNRQTKPPWRPHAPANLDWPDYVKRMYTAGCERIDELRKQIDEDGVLTVPFRCYACDKTCTELAFLNGDGVPVCVECAGGAEICKEMAEVE
jgi:hypothetical protein